MSGRNTFSGLSSPRARARARPAVPAAGGFVVVLVRPFSVRLTFRRSVSGRDLARADFTLPDWTRLCADVEVALDDRVGLLPCSAGVH